MRIKFSFPVRPPDETSAKNPRRSLWLRNSMRKTKLIPLPNQLEAQQQLTTASGSSASSSRDGEGSSLVPVTVPPPQSVSVPPEASPPTMEDFISFNRITFNPSVQQPVNQIHEERQRSREPPVVRDVPIIITAEEEQFHYPPTAPTLDQLAPQSTLTTTPTTIPRQLGRRSEQSPRVLAINAESNTIVIGRPTSAPARVGLVQRGEVVDEGNPSRRSVRVSGNHRGREFDSMSSVDSSRNPSPVSLASSTGSSMTSAHNGTSQER